MRARTDRATVVNLLHHSYWNLAGHDSGDVRRQGLRLPADFYLPINDALVPTGEVRGVACTVFDFRTAKPLGQDLDGVPTKAGGYDHNWCIGGPPGELRLSASLADPVSGRALDILSTEPGLQLYTGGHFRQPVVGKAGAIYRQYAGLALETQRFPDAPNLSHFPNAQLAPGETYEHRMQIHLRAGA